MGIKTYKSEQTSIFIVNKEAKVKFLIEQGKKEFKLCTITSYIGGEGIKTTVFYTK